MNARARFAHVDPLERALTERHRHSRFERGCLGQQEAIAEGRAFLLESEVTLASLSAVLMAKHSELPGQLDLWEKGMAAASAAVISTLVANPLELVKTRMQAALHPSSAASTSLRCTALTLSTTSGGAANAWRVGSGSVVSSSTLHSPAYRSALDGLLRIARHEGPGVLWRGTDLSLLVAVPMVAMYFPLYDSLLQRFQTAGIEASPFLAGAVARTATAFVIQPLELFRVRVQGGTSMPPNASYFQQLGQVLRQIHGEGQGKGIMKVRGLWRGMGVTLAKDVPFAAGYWALMEPLRAQLLPKEGPISRSQVFLANASAGFAAAAVSAGMTTPLDVAKTHVQTAPKPVGMVQSLRDINARGGVRALFTGAGPRSMRAGCAYAILMSSYEAFKSMELRAHLHPQQAQL
ncbi:Solute carrier family 25 member 40 [Coccomyxa sp. Obi]|nr:Solute carrier family 25 member 40 [Coccomyxa sp. Obi]